MSEKNVYQRINAVMGKVSYVQKEQKQGMRYSIVSHDSVTALLRPHMQAEGIVYHPVSLQSSQNGNRTEVTLSVRFASMDDPKDFIDVPSMGYGIDDQDKGPGKAISYAVKYALLKTFGLETGDDPDNDQNSSHVPEAPRKAPEMPDGTRTITVLSQYMGENYGSAAQRINTADGAAWNQDMNGLVMEVGESYEVICKKGTISQATKVDL